MNWVRDQAEKEADLQQYVPHLQSNTILRLLQQVITVFFLSLWNSPSGVSCTLLHCNSDYSSTQVAQIYQSIEFTRLASLVPFVDAFQLERSIVDAARHCDLQVCSTRGLVTIDNSTNSNVCLQIFSYLGPYRSYLSNSELWI